jgi:hypothetical protein
MNNFVRIEEIQRICVAKMQRIVELVSPVGFATDNNTTLGCALQHQLMQFHLGEVQRHQPYYN